MKDTTYAITAREEALLPVCAYLALAIVHEINTTSIEQVHVWKAAFSVRYAG
jgi:hypothetical protein